MTATKAKRSCPECELSGSWHFSEDGSESWRCPNFYAADAAELAQKLTADAHTQAFKAAKQIIADAAAESPELNGNTVRAAMDAAQIPSGVVGAAFSACAREGLIEATGRYVQSTEPTTRHRIQIWASLSPRFRAGKAAS